MSDGDRPWSRGRGVLDEGIQVGVGWGQVSDDDVVAARPKRGVAVDRDVVVGGDCQRIGKGHKMLGIHVSACIRVADDEITRPAGVVTVQGEDRANDEIVAVARSAQQRVATVDLIPVATLTDDGGQIIANGPHDIAVEVDEDGLLIGQGADRARGVPGAVGTGAFGQSGVTGIILIKEL